MNKKLVYFFGIIFFIILLGVFYAQYINYFPNQEIDQKINQRINQVQVQEKIKDAYLNERFGYEITCEDPWYIWPYYSLEMAVVKQTRSQSFKQKWTVENSEILFLTDLSQEDTKQFFDEDGRINIADLPVGHWMQIFPIDIDPDLEKKSLKEKGLSRIEVKTITLQNGLKAQQTDTILTGRILSILVPHNFNSKLDSGEQAKSLNFITDAEAGSDSEKAFYKIINSLNFY